MTRPRLYFRFRLPLTRAWPDLRACFLRALCLRAARIRAVFLFLCAMVQGSYPRRPSLSSRRKPTSYMRKTPKASLPRTTSLKAALSAMPSTVRVSRGSTMPSSHRRAVA
jgi:hypothetical protein